MLNRLSLGIGVSLLAAVAGLGWLWQNAAENAREATQEVRRLESNLTAVLDSERRSRELEDALQDVLTDWQVEREAVQADLVATRRTLNQIRAAAREETADASLVCAVRAVPADVDRLLDPAAVD